MYICKTEIQVDNNGPSNTAIALRTIYSLSKGTKVYYNILNNSDCTPYCCAKWPKRSYCNVCWKSCFLKIHRIDDIEVVANENVVLKKINIIN